MMSVGYILITGGTTNPPTSNNLPKVQVGHTTLVLLAPSKAILFYRYQALGSQGQGAEDYFQCQFGILSKYQYPELGS